MSELYCLGACHKLMVKRYGLIYVDKHDDGTGTLERKRKQSFYWYKKVIESNGEVLE